MTTRITTRIRRAILWLTDVRTKRFCVMFVVFGPIGYVLSIGPFLWLTSRDYIGPDSPANKIGWIYEPLGWLHRNSDSFADFIFWYSAFWLPTI